MHSYSVISRSVVSEKSRILELSGVHSVIVDPKATKVDIRSAFETLYGVEVESVNIVKIREKYKGGRRGTQVKRRSQVKALVKLAAGSKLADFQKIKTK
jgi:large subunit ribosomal protein L23